MQEYFGWGFPTDKLKQQVFNREPDSPGGNPFWCLDTSTDGSCRSGMLVRLRALVVWSSTEVQRYEFARMERVRRTDSPGEEKISFVYEGQVVGIDLPGNSHFPRDMVEKFAASKDESFPEASNVCACRLPEQTHPVLKLVYLMLAGGKVVLNPQVSDAEQAKSLPYRKAWVSVGDESLFFIADRGAGGYEKVVHQHPLGELQDVTTQALPASALLRNAFLRNLWTSVGLGVLILVLVMFGLRGEEVPGDRLVLGAMGSLLGGIVLGLLMLVLPDALRGRHALILYLLKVQGGNFLALAADSKQERQLARMLESMTRPSRK